MTIVPFGLAERTEIEAYGDFAAGAADVPGSAAERLGAAALRTGPALALCVREDRSGFFNRAGGFADDVPVGADVLTHVRDFYREQGLRQGSMMIAPTLLSEDWPVVAKRLGLTAGSSFVKLGWDLAAETPAPDGLPPLDAGLRVGLVEPRQAKEWATVMMTTFGFGAPDMIELAASCVGRPDWRQYAVYDSERIVAVGSVYLNGDCADMFGGATLPEARGRGAQSALLLARAAAAREAGCRWLVAETGAEREGKRNTSLRNMLRTGFEPLYERVTWVWREEA
ncbi:GNAT family N-acetyltransferase [Streptomyces tendae]|uniref:N-acetyltransferase n=1 Tax=Streptomyces tendae TaxID=1932 RepID=A0ABX6A0N6_STRTE|nr:GNAT family N-acetyltransferase [Streptomyces tendae]QER90502.1 N-acetyltransferase [Streptomyces tendae]